ncbi:AAA family ATPase [Rhodospira trueperi]|uniref:Pilus assembly protein CpaE n=1 Tax=Rhodospira trueperi TaxID=69960 RepID=A0A1G7DZD8_9PROT|nr:AAA family ATPase [Rhodospira trueperi]SDE56774.1 pilus assembly protein CpaE [Rhodospira trueperi]
MRITVEAFVQDDRTRAAVDAVSDDVRMRRSRVNVHGGGLAEAPAVLARTESPDLLILESDKHSDGMMDELDAVADYVAPESSVIVIGIDDSIALYRQLVGMGVADYLVGPPSEEDLLDAVLRVGSSEADQALAPVVAVMGVRGGVGSSTLACNLAYKLGRDISGEVVLVDLDISSGTAAINLNLSPRQSAADILGQPDMLDSAAFERYMQRYDDHLVLLGSTAQLDIAFRPPSDVLEALLNVLRRQYDVVVLDLPRQWSVWVRDLLLDASAVVLVAYPDLSNLRDVQKMTTFLTEKRKMSLPTCVVLNKVGMAQKAELAAKDFEDVLGRAPTASVPFEPVPFGQALNNGEPVLKKSSSKTFVRSIDQLAESLHLDLKPGTRASRKARKGLLAQLLSGGGKDGKKKKRGA